MRFRSKKRRSAGKRQHKTPSVQIKIQNGRFQISGMGTWYSYWRDPYHMLLTVPFMGFLLLVVLSYGLVNALFALLYLVGKDSIANAQPGSFADAFFFSVQTMASIGYGAMYPQTLYAHIVVTIEAIFSMGNIAVLTGLAFARFSRPTARVLFSRVAVVAPYEGAPTLIFRCANQRRNQILEAQMRVYLTRDEITAEGKFMRRFHELTLVRSQTPSFALSWSVMHAIDEYSPLYGATVESLTQTNTSIVVSLSGLDETVAQVIYARQIYSAQDILWNHNFVDIFYPTPEGHRYIDYRYFHEVSPLE